MARPLKRFVCQSCGAVTSKWSGRCESCGEWNTIIEEAGAAVAEWQSSCVSALLGKPEEGPGDFLRYTAWAWRPAVASERDGQDAQSG